MKKLILHASMLIAAGCLNIGAAEPEKTIPPPPGPCAHPITQTFSISQPQAVSPNLADFPTKCSNGWQTKFGQGGADKCLRHTFTWKLKPGCQVLSGKLTIVYKANYAGPQYANNDTVAIYSNGTAVPGTSQNLYSGTVIVGQQKTKMISLTAAMLSSGHLSFLVQDDTTVVSATLQTTQCCLKP
jgi:hypothetical protein